MPEMPPFSKWKVPATSVATVWGTAVTWVGLVSWQSRRKLVADVQKNNDGKRKMWADTCRSKFKSWGILRDGADHLVKVCMSVDFLIYCREIRLVTGWWRNSYWCVCVWARTVSSFSPVFWVWENLISFPPPLLLLYPPLICFCFSGYSCRLVTHGMSLIIVNEDSLDVSRQASSSSFVPLDTLYSVETFCWLLGDSGLCGGGLKKVTVGTRVWSAAKIGGWGSLCVHRCR